jgi:diadenosine tetraphosphatase ApaH/serine/threonine PP2A family protein phosphatase
MRVAVISDIHGNLHALEAVLAAIDADPPDAVWCLGDVVGYGPRPNECCDLVRRRATVSLCGNHDLAVGGGIDLAEFSGDAAVAATWTRRVLEDEHLAWLNELQPRAQVDGVGLFHGSARDPVWEYVLSDEAALATIVLAPHPLALVGHSHVALQVALHESSLEGGLAPAGTRVELADANRLLNPGSVGQPRDGDPRAAYLVLDLAARTASFGRVEYDVERTQSEIRAAGLPDVLAARLAFGQ